MGQEEVLANLASELLTFCGVSCCRGLGFLGAVSVWAKRREIFKGLKLL